MEVSEDVYEESEGVVSYLGADERERGRSCPLSAARPVSELNNTEV